MKGLTLIEILVSSVLVSLLALIVFSIFSVGESAYQADLGRLSLQQQLRQAQDILVREIRQAKIGEIVILENGKRFSFKIPVDIRSSPEVYSRLITYYLEGNSLLIREHPQENQKIIANNISNVMFRCCNPSGCSLDCTKAQQVEVELKAQARIATREIFLTKKEKISLRNEDK